MRKLNEENIALKARLDNEVRKSQQDTRRPPAGSSSKRKSGRAESILDSEERSSSAAAPSRGTKRGHETFIEKVRPDASDAPRKARRTDLTNPQEESYVVFPAVKIHLPDAIKSLLVDDWEAITKNQSLVPLPVDNPVTKILDDYRREESKFRKHGSADADILEEIIIGLLEYFNRALPRILLYRPERPQWNEISTILESAENVPKTKKAKLTAPTKEGFDPAGIAGKKPAEVYGAEHLIRLFVSLPELIAQTNMDKQAVSKLRDEIQRMSEWLGRSANRYFNKQYESYGAEYRAKAKAVA